jgi:AraC-like DNA-binding protein
MYTIEAVGTREDSPTRSWSSITSAVHCAMDVGVGRAEGFRGRLARQRSAEFQLVRWWSGEARFERTARHVARDERGTVELFLPLTGAAVVEQGRSRSTMRPGDMALYAIDRPVTLWHVPEFSGMTLIIPAGRVEQRSSELTDARLFDGTRGLGRIALTMLRTLREQRTQLSGAGFDASCDRLVDLLCLTGTSAAEPGVSGTHRGDVEAAIRRYVRTHLEDAELSTRSISAALGWSPRYVQAVLPEAGTTPTELIRDERLALARGRLEHADYRSWPIERVGRSCGFPNASAFSAAFRRRYGMSPRDARPSR